MGEWLLSRMNRQIVARHEVPGLAICQSGTQAIGAQLTTDTDNERRSPIVPRYHIQLISAPHMLADDN
jgi:hypothetical protein